MAFWGVQVKPGSPFTLKFDAGVRRRLHVSQATLAAGTSNKTSVVQCNVGNKSPVLLCALLPDKAEAFTLRASSLLCMTDSEGNARKVVGCSCVVVKIWLRGTQHKVGRLSAGSKITSILTANDMVLCGTETGLIKSCSTIALAAGSNSEVCLRGLLHLCTLQESRFIHKAPFLISGCKVANGYGTRIRDSTSNTLISSAQTSKTTTKDKAVGTPHLR